MKKYILTTTSAVVILAASSATPANAAEGVHMTAVPTKVQKCEVQQKGDVHITRLCT
ncbi:hypothetical protein ACQPZP_34795 [Spirillospora sp. CA-142024]|uniref:hypothetical protein n=1 Tax=Spirillospora sp. CA-142024 TaxID=3240036 RepID=UPI003D94BB8A